MFFKRLLITYMGCFIVGLFQIYYFTKDHKSQHWHLSSAKIYDDMILYNILAFSSISHTPQGLLNLCGQIVKSYRLS